MDKDKLRNYYSSLLLYKKMLNEGNISKDEYVKIETHLAKKYCIKIDSIIRSNDLINNSFRGIYCTAKKGGKNE